MSNLRVGQSAATSGRHDTRWYTHALIAVLATFASFSAFAQSCVRTLTADVIAFDQPIMYNRLGASNINGMMFALRRDVVDKTTKDPIGNGGSPGGVELRPDKRPRPLVLRIAAGDCLQVTVTNLLTPNPNPNSVALPGEPPFTCKKIDPVTFAPKDGCIDEQVADRTVGFHVSGMQLVGSIASDSSNAGKNADSLVPQGQSRTYTLYGEKEGAFLVQSLGSTIGGDANQGNTTNGLFGQVIVEPKGARIYRSLLTEEEMRLATVGRTSTGQPRINYEAVYPTASPWTLEGKAGLPILNSIQGTAIVHSEIEMMVVGPNADGSFPPSTYPLESTTRRNPTIPNRLEPFRDLAQVWHDEPSTTQAFPGFYNHPVFKYVLAGVKDGFMINYGSGGIGSEIIANRLGVGPMHDCLNCTYEEFFLTSFTVGDPALLVDIPANVGLETLLPGQTPAPGTTGPKATKALYPSDPINVHHAYIGDFIKFRNTHIGKEQHVFHLHNHQWLYNPNDDNANYLDAQGVGPGIGYTYEINFGGSGNRNKSAGDAIFHCHFYPHFAQGMWYHLRNYDTFEEGTRLAVSGAGFHSNKWDLKDGTPAAGSRALPDGELVYGVPLVAIVPLPGKAMAPMPGKVEVVANPVTLPSGRPVGSVAKIDKTIDPSTGKVKNPGYPFWIAGMEDAVGQRPPTPVLDMITPTQANALRAEDPVLFATLNPAQADGWDGGLPRHALLGYAAGGRTEANVVSARDFTKIVAAAKPLYYPEGGTEVEKGAMAFHKKGQHATAKLDLAGTAAAATFVTNGVGPVVGAPYHEPCRDDTGKQMKAGITGNFFSGGLGSASAATNYALETTHKQVTGKSVFNADSPRIYKGVNIQFDAILNKVGYHFPQQRIIALWQDAFPVIDKQQPPEPLVMRLNTFDCAVFSHSNLVPEYYEMDDYQVRTPTDIIGQHIHLPKWDLTTTDGAANGWNYEDGTLSPGAVRERIHAINEWNIEHVCNNHGPAIPPTADAANRGSEQQIVCPVGTVFAGDAKPVWILTAAAHPYFGQFSRPDWDGARTTMQRWFADPVVNTDGVDRGLGIIFTHDHYGPSTHQQIGLYATVLAQPAGSEWKHNETGTQLGASPITGAPARTATYVGVTDRPATFTDGGPTSWQAAILPPKTAPAGTNVGAEAVVDFREFYFEFSDFQHAYEKGFYVGAGPDGRPLADYVPPPAVFDPLAWIPNPGNVLNTTITESFRVAINPPARKQKAPVFPDLVVEVKDCVLNPDPNATPADRVLLSRPCPTAIDVQDPGVMVVNYRNEPVALRVFDPNKTIPNALNANCTANNPDRTFCGMQADGLSGDLAYALATRITTKDGTTTAIPRKIPELNKSEAQLAFWGKTLNSAAAVDPNDPFTPMIRAYMGDQIRVKIQAGGHEEEHNASIHGMKWLQGGSGHGKQPNSGWRASQAAGISEQFTLAIPMVPPGDSPTGSGFINYRDYLYNIDSSMDGWWSGTWGVIRAYDSLRTDLFVLPSNTNVKPDRIVNKKDFKGVCPVAAPQRAVSVVAILANDLLDAVPGVTITPAGSQFQHVGAALTGNGTLVYNPRTTTVAGTGVDPVTGVAGPVTHQGPLHDPTAMMYVRVEDLVPRNATLAACKDNAKTGNIGVTNAECPVKLRDGYKPEPLVLRGNAGDCMNVTLYNRLPAVAPDLPTYATLQAVVKRDRTQAEGSVPFDNNLIRPSTHVGLSPQLATIDPFVAMGVNAGQNITQTVAPVTIDPATGKKKTLSGLYRWYLGDLAFPQTPTGGISVAATPVEFGGSGLSPADKIKQGQKSLVGGLVVAPQGATIAEDKDANGKVVTRAQATVTAGTKTFRDFMMVMTKDLNHRYADGSPVEHMNGEGVGIPEDSQENSNMAINYGIEPMWFRFGILPQAPFGGAGCGDGPGCYGGVPNAHEAFSNALAGVNGDPATPVFRATKGQEVRIHSAVPHGTSRGSTWTFHGHVWQRDPYICPGETRNGLTGACNMTGVASRALGINPYGFAQGAQESNTPYSHFTFLFPSAGGAGSVPGDYLFRDVGSFGSASGLWGLLRVQ